MHTSEKIVLIVEDEPILTKLYREKFEQAGFIVEVAGNARQGVALAKRTKPDIVLLDILLPEENGLYFLQEVRTDRVLADLPVIIFSNYRNTIIEESAKRLGVSEYITKANFDPDEVVDKVKKVLNL
jgi:DNA-binding response OmpR family regulator